MGPQAVALWCALVVATRASAYTVDCNHRLTDCDSELSKITSEDAEASTTALPTVDLTTESQNEPKTTVHIDKEEQTKRGRLLDVDELHSFANALHNQTKESKKLMPDLSDVNLDDDDEQPSMQDMKSRDKVLPDKFYTNLQAPFHPLMDRGSEETDVCKENNNVYKLGDKIERGCEETCECMVGGSLECSPRCKHPYIRRGRKLSDPLCFESPVDECCSIIACATGNGEMKAPIGKVEVCRFGNDTHVVGSKWEVGCEQICTCEKNSIVNCKPRCPTFPQSESCINVQDPHDACCEVQVCDVSQDAHEEHEGMANKTSTTASPMTEKPKEQTTKSQEQKQMRPLVLAEPIGSVKVLQNNSVQVTLMQMNTTEDPVHLELSSDGGKTYKDVELTWDNLILNLEGGKDYVLKTKETNTKFNFTITAMDDTIMFETNKTIGCHQDGKFYAVGEEFHIGCEQLCECMGDDVTECAALECPNHVGLELVSHGCVRWAPNPPATPPNCCPRSARCLSDGTCHYKGVAIPNWTDVPITLSGCEQRCFCENGELDCQEVCSPLPALPPQTLRCPPMHRVGPVNASYDDCCKQWGCIPNVPTGPDFPPMKPTQPFLPTLPPDYSHEDIPDYDQNNVHKPLIPHQGEIPDVPSLPDLPTPPNYGEENKKLSVISLQADSPTSVKMLFGLPPVLVGLRGSVDLRYTDGSDDNIARWYSQVFAPANEILTTSRLEFRLSGLKPSTTYRIRGKLYLHNLPVEPESDIYSVHTLDLPVQIPEEKQRTEIDSQLMVVDVNDTTARVSWRHFNEEELRFIDGIQIRYRPVGTPIYLMTELLHHSRTTVELRDLRPASRYEAELVVIAPPPAAAELKDPKLVYFTTSANVDPYEWSVTVEAHTIGSEGVEVSWRGVPEPAERWVRVFRAAHACGAGRTQEHDAFRLATRDTPNVITLTGLEPDTRCRVWLELFLTNGKVKTSNVLEVNTKSLDDPEDVDNIIEASSVAGSRGGNRGDYYGALVGVGVIAALGALTSLLLLLVVVRRHRPRSANITPVPSAPRESSLPPYDNPAYKLELQQETMDL